jgi:large subunit ribosomal protein L23
MSRKRPVNANEVSLSRAQMYDIVREPVITEKSTAGAENNEVTFRVPLDASKPEVKVAVESLFNVRVTNVNTLRHKGKRKRFRGISGKRADTKKAFVTLAEGYHIDVTTGI